MQSSFSCHWPRFIIRRAWLTVFVPTRRVMWFLATVSTIMLVSNATLRHPSEESPPLRENQRYDSPVDRIRCTCITILRPTDVTHVFTGNVLEPCRPAYDNYPKRDLIRFREPVVVNATAAVGSRVSKYLSTWLSVKSIDESLRLLWIPPNGFTCALWICCYEYVTHTTRLNNSRAFENGLKSRHMSVACWPHISIWIHTVRP